MPIQMAAVKGELQKETSMLRSELVAEKQHAAVLQVTRLATACFIQYCPAHEYRLLLTHVEPIFPDSISRIKSFL